MSGGCDFGLAPGGGPWYPLEMESSLPHASEPRIDRRAHSFAAILRTVQTQDRMLGALLDT